MDYSRLKHASATLVAIGGLTGAIGAFLGSPGVILVGASTAVLGGLGRYAFGEADGRQRKRKEAQGATSIAMPALTLGSEMHSEIDEAVKHTAEGNPALTIELLEKIRRKRWDQLTDRQRYRLIANLGNAKLSQRKPAEAARDFIRTVDYQPRDEDARAYEALGHLFLEDHERARELSLKLCIEYPGLGRAHMIRVRTEPEQTPFDELLRSVPVGVRTHPEVALALCHRAVAQDRLRDAEAVIRATDLTEWPALPISLGGIILKQELAHLHITPEGPSVSHPERLSEALTLLTSGIERLSPADPNNFQGYLHRGTCHRLFGRLDQAREDFWKAHKIAPDEEQAHLALARVAYDEKRLDEATGVLERYLDKHTSPEGDVLLAFLLHERNLNSDLAEAEKRLVNAIPHLDELEENQRTAAIESLADIYLTTGRGEEALNLLRGSGGEKVSEAKRRSVEGIVLLRLGRTEDAQAQAHAARAALGDSPDENSVRKVAILFQRLEEYRAAFGLWRSIAAPDYISLDTKHLLRCAKEASEDAFILAYCAKLRATGVYDPYILSCELDVLLRYSEYTKFRDVSLDYLSVNPDDKTVRLNLSAVAIQQGWQDLVETDPARLPSVSEAVSVAIGERVVSVLRFGPNPARAVDYAYALYRRFPDDPASNRALIASIALPGREELEIPKPDVVTDGTAVCYKTTDTDDPKWLVIEDEEPSLTRNEYPRSHLLVQALFGKKVGDEFQFPGAGIRQRTGTIVELRDKRLYRANQLGRDWASRFPENFFLESVPVGDDPSPESFSEILKIMEAVAERGEKLEEIYANGGIPVASFAKLSEKTVFESVGHLASQSNLRIRACVGSTDERQASDQLLDRAEKVVLDPTAIASLVLLEEIHVLRELPFRCIVTEGALREIREVIRERHPTPKTVGYLSARAGRLVVEDIDQEAARDYTKRLERVIADLEEQCQVLGGSALAEVNSVQRERMLEYVARESAEAVAAAHSQEGLLWSDDRLLHSLVNEDLPASRVWTQAVFMWANERGILEHERKSRITARLLRFGYVFTSLNPATVLDTCEAALWDATEPHLVAVLQDFGNPAWDHVTALQMTGESIKGIWRGAPTVEHARAVTAQMLAHLADRQDCPEIVRMVKDNTTSLLGLAATRAPTLRETLETFLRSGGIPL